MTNRERIAQVIAERRAAEGAAGTAAQQASREQRQKAAIPLPGLQIRQAVEQVAADKAAGVKLPLAQTVLPTAVKASLAKKEYEDYKKSDEAKQSKIAAGLLAGQKDVTTAPKQGAVAPGTYAGRVENRETNREAALKAQADYYANRLRLEEDRKVMEKDMAEYETWSEEDRNNLQRYITERDADVMNILGEPGFDNYNLNPIISKYGEGKVRQMAESVKRSQNEDLTRTVEQETTKRVKENPWASGILESTATVPAKLFGDMVGTLGRITDMGQRTGRYQTLDPNSGADIFNAYSGAVREQTAENIRGNGKNMLRNLAALGYQGGMSALDSAARMVAAGGNPGISAAIAASGSFSNGMRQYSAQGATPAEAATMAFVDAGLEYVTEKLSDAKMLEFFEGGSKPELIKKFLWQTFGVEPLGEEVNLFAGIAAQAAILGDKSSQNQQIGEMVANGMSYEEASREYWKGVWDEAKQTYAVSAISAGMSSAGSTWAGIKARDIADQNKAQNAAGKPTQAQMPQNTPSQKQMIANAVAEATGGQAAQIDKVIEPDASLADSVEVSDEHRIKEQMRKTQDVINAMQPVADIQTPTDFDKLTKTERKEWVIKKLQPTGYKVDRKGFGIIHFGAKRLKTAFKYLKKGSAEQAAFEAMPYVLEHGKQIGGHEDHKNREYGTFTFAAPVIIDGVRGNMAVVVTKTTDNFYKVHRILAPDGTVFKFDGKTNEAEPSLAGESPETGSLATPISSASNQIILDKGNEVNNKSVSAVDIPAQSADSAQIKGTGAAEANFTGVSNYENMLREGNSQPERAGDVRSVEMPKVDSDGRRVTEFASNVVGASVTPDSMADAVKSLVGDKKLSFDTVSNQELLNRAAQSIRDSGEEEAYISVHDAVESKSVPEGTIEKGLVLYAKYANDENMQDRASSLIIDLAALANRAGRDLQLFRMVQRMTPEGQLMAVKKNVNRAVESINRSRSKGKQVNATVDENLERAYMSAARDALSKESAVESAVAKTIEDGLSEDAGEAAETALATIYFGGKPAQKDNQTGIKERNTEMVQTGQNAEIDLRWGEVEGEQNRRPDANVQTNDMNERIGQRVADSLTRQAREQNRSVEDVLYSEIMRFANDKADRGRQPKNNTARNSNLEAMRDYYRYRPFFQNAWNIARDRVEQAMFSMQDGDPRIPVIEQFLASGDEVLGVENWNPIGALDYANPNSTIRRGAKEAATAAGIRMDNRSEKETARVRQEMRDVLIENAQSKQNAARKIAQIAVESMGLDGQAAEAMAADITRAFYNDLAQQSARRVAQMFGTDRRQQQKVQKTMMGRLAELYNMGAFSNEQYRQAAFDSIFGENSGIDIDDSLMETFVNAAGERRDQAATDIYKAVAAQIKPTLGEMWDAWRNLAMLGNVKTHIRNIAGSAAFQPYVMAKNAVGAAIESAVLKQENRTKAVVGASKNDRALLSWAKGDGKTASVKALMDYSGSTGDNARSEIEDARQILPGKWDTARKKNMAAMERSDMFFKQNTYAMSMASFLKARGYTAEQVQNGQVPNGVLDEGRRIAVREAMRATFNDRNRFSDAIGKLRFKGNDPASKLLNVVAKGILPFTRTPANVLVRAVEYSPAGIVRSVNTIFNKAKNGEATIAEGIDQLAAGLTGTGAMFLGAAMASGMFEGFKLVGKLEEEEKEAGAREYSLKIGDEYYGIEWLAPANMPLFIGANVYQTLQKKNNAGEDLDAWDILSFAVESASDVLDPMLELSMLSSLNEAIETMSYQESAGDKALALLVNSATSYFTQGLPTLLGQFEQASETTKKSTYSNADNPVEQTFQRVVGNATQRIPGIDLYQKERVDAEGNTVANEGNWIQRGFNALINPVNKYTEATGPVWDEKARLNKVLPDSVSSPSIPKKISYTDTNGQKHNNHLVSAEEYATMEKVQRQTENAIMESCVKSPVYGAMTDAQKGKVFDYAQEYAREKARSEALEGYEKPGGWMADIDGKEMDTILQKVAQKSITDAIDDGEPQDLEQALTVYNALDDKQRRDMLENAGGRTEYFLKASKAGVNAETFLDLYQQYKDIDGGKGNASQKANQWGFALENAKDKGLITQKQKAVFQDSMGFRYSMTANSEKLDEMVESGVRNNTALDITKIVARITGTGSVDKETGKRSVRAIDKYGAIAGSGYPSSEIDAVMKAYMPDYDPTAASPDKTELKYDTVRDLGYTPQQYAETYAAYLDESKKKDKIQAIENLGYSPEEAKQLYAIYYGSYFK